MLETTPLLLQSLLLLPTLLDFRLLLLQMQQLLLPSAHVSADELELAR